MVCPWSVCAPTLDLNKVRNGYQQEELARAGSKATTRLPSSFPKRSSSPLRPIGHAERDGAGPPTLASGVDALQRADDNSADAPQAGTVQRLLCRRHFLCVLCVRARACARVRCMLMRHACVRMSACARACACVHARVCVQCVCVCAVCVCVCVCVCVSAFALACACMCACVCPCACE